MYCTNTLVQTRRYALGANVLGHGLGALADGVLGQLAGEQKADCGLDLPTGDGETPVVVRESAGLADSELESDFHGVVLDLAADAGVVEDLAEHVCRM